MNRSIGVYLLIGLNVVCYLLEQSMGDPFSGLTIAAGGENDLKIGHVYQVWFLMRKARAQKTHSLRR